MSIENIINSGKRILEISLLAGMLAMNPLLIGCGRDGETHAPGISEELQDQWPIWKPADLEVNNYKGPALVYDNTLNIKPDFYKGSMPLQYKSSQTPGMGFMTGTSKIIKHEFKDFSNYFIYEAVFLAGVVAVDNSNTMVAEARLKGFEKKDMENGGYIPIAEVEEFHYRDGFLAFHCISRFETSTGIKQEETNCSGKKQRDYFFIIPLGISP
ncbi:MAG: hypothetical protein ABIH72_00565 [archaeon]